MSMSHTREYLPRDTDGGSLFATVIMQPKLKQITWYWEDKTKIIIIPKNTKDRCRWRLSRMALGTRRKSKL